MVKPYLFEYELGGENIVVEAEYDGALYLFKKGTILNFFSLSEEIQKEIVNKIDEHFFMRDAAEGWAK